MALPVVVIRSNDVCFLGILRSLAAVKIPAIPVIYSWNGAPEWFSENSRHFRNPVRIPNPFEDEQGAVRALAGLGSELVAKHGRRLLLLASSDTSLVLVQNHYGLLSKWFDLIGSEGFQDSRVDVLDKGKCSDLLAAAGVAVPAYQKVDGLEDVERAVTGAVYPSVVKPVLKDYGQTFYRIHGGLKAIECRDPAGLRRELHRLVGLGFRLIVQQKLEILSARDEVPQYLFVGSDGQVDFHSGGWKALIYPEPFGTAVVLQREQRDDLLVHGMQVARALNWRGLLMVEWIRDPVSDRWCVIEVNCRPWLFVDFYRRCGINFVGQTALYHAERRTLSRPRPISSATQVHVSISGLVQRLDLQSPKVLEDWMESMTGVVSLTYLDPDDPEPAKVELSSIAAARGWRRSDAEALFGRWENLIGY